MKLSYYVKNMFFSVFRGEFPELRPVLVLPVAPPVVVPDAAEALPLHRDPQHHAEPAGPQRHQPG